MTRRNLLMFMLVLLALAAVPWGIGVAQAGPGGGTYYANSPAGFRTAATGTFYTGTPLRKFVDSLPGLGPTHANNLGNFIPVATPMTPPAGVPNDGDYYNIGLVDITQKLHSDLPKATKLRVYKDLNPAAPANPNGSYYLGPVIVAAENRPVRIKFENHLGAGSSGDLFIPVDTTAMGAGVGSLKSDGSPCDPFVPGQCALYTQNRAVIHLHGGVTPWISDGTPRQWITSVNDSALTTPYLKGESQVDVPDMFSVAGQGIATIYYTNQQSARLMFYHDHAYGITRLNVYAGEVAGYLIHDPQEDALIAAGTLPNQGGGVYNYGIPLIIQDKTFVPQDIAIQDSKWDTTKWGQPGDLWFPHVYEPNQSLVDGQLGANPFGRWDYGPWFWPPVPVAADKSTLPEPSMVPEAFMDTPLVNGAAYPYLQVQPQAYRFRVLNGSNDRALNLQLYYVDPANPTEVKMVPALPHTAGSATPLCAATTATNDAGLAVGAIDPATGNPLNGTGLPANCWPTTWPIDGRDGGVPDPTTAGPAIIQIGTEGGFLPKPVVIPSTPVGYDYNRRSIVVLNVLNKGLFLQPAERADIIIDFSQVPSGSNLILYNDAPAPVPGFDPRYDYYTGDPDETPNGGAPSTLTGYGPNMRTIMQFQVSGSAATPFNLAALKNPASGLPNAFKLSQPNPIVPESSYGDTYGTTYGDTYAKIQDFSLTFSPANVPAGQAIRGISVVSGGAGYTSAPTVSFVGGGCTATPGATAIISGGVVTYVTLDNPGAGCTSAPAVTFTGGGFTTTAVATANFEPITLPMQPKAIQELWDMYGRMNATLGMELPFTNNNIQTTIPLGYVDPITERVPNGQIQLFRITHNGVDTHPVHFHLYNVQLINRVGWDGQIRRPDDNELGWKETVRMNPLEDAIVALQPKIPTGLPFAVINSQRVEDTTEPQGALITVTDPLSGNAVTITNDIINYGWEYVWHCHILGHEENDFMRPFSVMVPGAVPATPAIVSATSIPVGNTIQLNWNAASSTLNPDPATYFKVLRSDITGEVTTIYPGAAQGVASISVTNGGSGYSATPTVTISSPFAGFAQAGATATVSGGVITAITVGTPGSGYLDVPTVTITDTTGTGATAVANFGYSYTDTWVNSNNTYNYSVIASNSIGDSAAATASITSNTWTPATGVGISASPAPITNPTPDHYLSGTKITFTATGSGATGSFAYQYRFWLTDNATAIKSLVQDYSATASWSLPVSTPPGNYTVTVDVRTTLTSQTPDISNTANVLVISSIPARTKIGVFRQGAWYVDMNENGMWDPGTDAVMSFGMSGDIPVIGDWSGTGVPKIGIFRGGVWYLDSSANFSWTPLVDTVASFGLPGDIPVVGDWGSTGKTKIGVFRNGNWYLDASGDNVWGAGDLTVSFGMAGDIPVVGNWGTTNTDKIGVFRNGIWYLDASGDNAWGAGDLTVPFGLPGDIPVVGDWGNTGKAKIGVFRKGNFYLDYNGNNTWDGCGAPGDPTKDACFTFGLPTDIPIVGKW